MGINCAFCLIYSNYFRRVEPQGDNNAEMVRTRPWARRQNKVQPIISGEWLQFLWVKTELINNSFNILESRSVTASAPFIGLDNF